MITIDCEYLWNNVYESAKITCPNDANLTQALYAFVKATQFEGYSMKSWEYLIKKLADPIDGIDDNYSILDYLEDTLNP
jgi:hypothetical protein